MRWTGRPLAGRSCSVRVYRLCMREESVPHDGHAAVSDVVCRVSVISSAIFTCLMSTSTTPGKSIINGIFSLEKAYLENLFNPLVYHNLDQQGCVRTRLFCNPNKIPTCRLKNRRTFTLFTTFLLGALPGKLMQRIAQGLNTPQPSMGLGVVPALKQDWGGATQGLQTGGGCIASRIVPDFSEQGRSKTFDCSGQAAEDLGVFMAQKKLLDLLIIGSDLLHQRQQLGNQSQGHAP